MSKAANKDILHKSACCSDCGQTGLTQRPDSIWECNTCGHMFTGEPKLSKGKREAGKFITRKPAKK